MHAGLNKHKFGFGNGLWHFHMKFWRCGDYALRLNSWEAKGTVTLHVRRLSREHGSKNVGPVQYVNEVTRGNKTKCLPNGKGKYLCRLQFAHVHRKRPARIAREVFGSMDIRSVPRCGLE